MDLQTLIRLKTEAFRGLGTQTLLEADQAIHQEIAKGADADSGVIERALHTVFATMCPDRRGQIDRQFAEGLAGRRVLCVIDFAAIPYSFNILTMLMIANKYRVELGADVLDVALVAHASDPGIFRQDRHTGTSLEDTFRTLANNLGIGAARLMPKIGSILFFDNRTLFANFLDATRQNYQVFPQYYDIRHPVARTSPRRADVYSFVNLSNGSEADDVLQVTVPQEELAIARRWMKRNVYPAVPVTVTFRNFGFEPFKNSDVAEWSRILSSVRDKRVKFVLVPDYYDAFNELAIQGDHVVCCDEATLTVPFRAAIYSAAAFNIFETNGTWAIGYLSRTINYLTFMRLLEKGSSSIERYRVNDGLDHGGQLWGAGEFQRIVWNSESTDAMASAIDRMIGDLDAAGRLVPDWY
jgi:hypothetical protein